MIIVKKIFAFCSVIIFYNSASSVAVKEIVHIGNITSKLTQSTSCSKEKWGGKLINSCQCCITKHSLQKKKSSLIIKDCKKKKYCTEKNLKEISKNLQVGNDDSKLVRAVQKANLVATRISAPDGIKGLASKKTFLNLLKKLKKEGLYKGPTSLGKCRKVIQAKGGSFSTVILILLEDKDCTKESLDPEWEAKIVLKGLKSPDLELENLKILKSSNIIEKTGGDVPKISLYESVFSYSVSGKRYYYILLEAATGKAFMDIVKDGVAELGNIDRKKYKEMKESSISKAYGILGTKLANLHRRNMKKSTKKDKGGILRKTIIHGDLHYENVFVDGDVISLIDPESMRKSATGKLADPGHDIAKMILFPVAVPKKSLNIKGMGKKGISKRIFIYATAKPFLKAYIKVFTDAGADKAKLKKELSRILVEKNAIQMLIKYRKGKPHIYNPFVLPRVQKYLKSIIADL